MWHTCLPNPLQIHVIHLIGQINLVLIFTITCHWNASMSYPCAKLFSFNNIENIIIQPQNTIIQYCYGLAIKGGLCLHRQINYTEGKKLRN